MTLLMKSFPTENFRDFGYTCLTKTGVPRKSSQEIVDALITTSLRGVDSHGIRLLAHYIQAVQVGRINPKPVFRFTRTRSSTGILDADDGFGIAAGFYAMDQAIQMAKKTGVGAVSVSHSTHFGSAGLYTIRAAENGMIGYANTHVEALVLPFNGKKPFLGTNAISWAVPCAGEDPVVLDMATTVMTKNKLNMYKAEQKKIPIGAAADSSGRLTTNPKDAEFLMHFGGYKGYGIAFMVEVFSSMLTGMNWGPHITSMYPLTSAKRNLGHFFYAIDIEAFEKLATFKRRMRLMVEEIRRIPHVSKESVMVPGDPEKRMYEKRVKEGRIPIPEADFAVLSTVAAKLGIDPADILG
jgi:ureidoglycolate dehydrogenase (NAD+)